MYHYTPKAGHSSACYDNPIISVY